MGFGYFQKMRGYLLISLLMSLFIGMTSAFAANISSTGSGGNWSATSTWVGGVVPLAADNVTIVAGATVTLDVPSATVTAFTIDATGVFDINANSFTATGALTLNGAFRDGSGGGVFTLGGNYTINSGGVFNDNGNGISIVFNGSGTQTISGTYASASLEFYDFTVSGTGTVDNNLSTNIIVNRYLQSGGIFLAGTGTYTLGFSGTINGYVFDKSGGTFTAETATLKIASSVNIRMRIDASTSFYAITHAPPTGARVLSFDESNAASATYTITNSLNINPNSNGVAFLNQADMAYSGTTTLSYTTSNSLTIGNEWPSTSSPTNVTVNSTATFTLGTSRTVSGTFTQTGGSTFDVSGGTFTINGTFSKGSGSFTTSVGTLAYGASALLNYTATQTAGVEWKATVPNVTISAGTVTLAAASGTRTITNALTVTSTLTANDNALSSGTLTDNGTITTTNVSVSVSGTSSFGNSSSLNTGSGAVNLTGNVTMGYSSQIVTTGSATMEGSLDVTGGATVGTSTAGTLVMGGSSTATVNVDGSLTIFDFTVNKTGGASTIVTPSSSVQFKFNTNATLYVQMGVLQMTSSSQFLNTGGANISASDNVTLKVGASGTLKTADVSITGFNVFTLADQSTIEFSGAAAQDVPAATYGNITVSTTHSSGATLAGDITLQTNSTVTVATSSRLNFNGKVITHPGTNSDDLIVSSSASLYTDGTSITGFNTFSSLAGTVVFNGTSQETMPSATYANVTINNAGGVALGGTATVTTTLTFTNGTVTSTSTNLLTLGVSATATPSSSSFVLGPVARATDGTVTSFSFPVGIGTNLRKVSLSFATAPATSNTITAEAKGTATGATSSDPDIKTVEDDGYWTISTTLGTIPNYSGTFTTTNFVPSITSSSNVTMVRGTTPNFDTQGTSQSSATDQVTASFTTSFGDFAVGNLTSTYTWTGTTNNNWSVGTNWDLGSAPGNGDVVSIPTASTVLYDAGVTTTNYSSVTLTGSATLSLDATTFDFSGTTFVLGATGTLTFNGATITNYNSANTTYPSGSTVQFNVGTVQADAYGNLVVNNSGAIASSLVITVAGTFTKSGVGTYTANGAVSVTGTATLSAGTIDPIGGFTASGNIVGNGGQFSGSSGTVTLDGSSQQTISGSTALTFNNLTLNNASGLSISTGPTVQGILTLTSGLITTGANNLTIGTAGSISGASASKYVSGRLAKIYGGGAQAFTYPTGKGGEYLPLTLDFANLTSGYTRVVEQINSDANGKDPDVDAGLSKVSIIRYWEVSRVGTGGGIGGTIQMTLSYNSNDGVDASTTELDVAQLSTDVNGAAAAIGVWQSLGGNGTALTTGTIQSTTFTSGGDFYTFGDAVGGVDNSLPVELSAFEATPDFDQVNFTWTTSSELKNLGFNLYRKGSENTDWVSVNSEIIPGKGTYSAESNYSYTDKNVVAGHTYSYKLESVSYDGALTVEKIIKIDVPVPKEFALFKNYPNPFNPTTHINFQVPEYSTVTIVVYDISGREVKTLVNKTGYDAGKYDITWNATDNFENKVASGMYFYRFSAGAFNKMGRMILLK